MNGLSKGSVTWTEIDDTAHDQRIDNYLLKTLKGVPKSHVYRILRSGQVRVNSRRVDADYRLRQGDRVRIPPVRVAAPGTSREIGEPGTRIATCKSSARAPGSTSAPVLTASDGRTCRVRPSNATTCAVCRCRSAYITPAMAARAAPSPSTSSV